MLIVFIVGLNRRIKSVQHVGKYSNQNASRSLIIHHDRLPGFSSPCSLRSDVRTDSLVEMVKNQQSKSAELARIYRDENQDD